MRPKIVILTLLAAFAALGIIALLKGVSNKNGDAGGAPMSPTNQMANAVAPATNGQDGLTGGSGETGEVSQQVRDAVIDKQVEEIQNLVTQVDGSNNVIIINAILEKLNRPEDEVRKAALDAMRQLNDTNAIPGLKAAANAMTDARQKVAVLDTIDYLLLPNITDNATPDSETNYALMSYLATNGVHGVHGRNRVKPPHGIPGQAAASPGGAGQPQ